MSVKKSILIAIMAHAALGLSNITSAGETDSSYSQGPSKQETLEFITELSKECPSLPSGHNTYPRKSLSDIRFGLSGPVLTLEWRNSGQLGQDYITLGGGGGQTYTYTGEVTTRFTIPLDQLSGEVEVNNNDLKLSCMLKPCIQKVARGMGKVHKKWRYERKDPWEFHEEDYSKNSDQEFRSINIELCSNIDGNRLQKAYTHLIKLHGGKKPLF